MTAIGKTVQVRTSPYAAKARMPAKADEESSSPYADTPALELKVVKASGMS